MNRYEHNIEYSYLYFDDWVKYIFLMVSGEKSPMKLYETGLTEIN